MKKGFTLIELLVVIAIMAVLIAVALPNYLGIRQRANDSKKKQELAQIKNALRLYYSDYQKYPAQVTGGTWAYKIMAGCGADGTTTCETSHCGMSFASGADCSTNLKTYMKKFTDFNGTSDGNGWNYRSDGNDNFCLSITLENAGDTEAAASVSRCNAGYAGCNGFGYTVCAD